MKKDWSVVGQNGATLKRVVKVPKDVVDKFDDEEMFFYELFSDGSKFTLHELADQSRLDTEYIERIFHDEEWRLNRYIAKTRYRWGLKTEKVVEPAKPANPKKQRQKKVLEQKQ